MASAQRVVISHDNINDSEIELTVDISKVDVSNLNDLKRDLFDVVIKLPANQKQLKDIWKTYLWIKEPYISIPIDISKGRKNELELIFRADISVIKQATVAIRCGKYAPLAEVVYEIKLGTFIGNK